MKAIPTRDPMDGGFVRMHYCRYADDWCLFLIGSKSLATEIKERTATFLRDELGLELSESKTHITNLNKLGDMRVGGFRIIAITNITDSCYYTHNPSLSSWRRTSEKSKRS